MSKMEIRFIFQNAQEQFAFANEVEARMSQSLGATLAKKLLEKE